VYEKPFKLYWVYIVASRPRGVLYVGMTTDHAGRAWQHRERVREGFTRLYWVGRLVYFERHENAAVAAQRERAPQALPARLEDCADREAQSDMARPVLGSADGGGIRILKGVPERLWGRSRITSAPT
jgi:predicted GIY-YIG superfamily endonuclease